MTPPRVVSAEIEQTPEQIAAVLEEFLAEHAQAVVLEDGKVLFDMRSAKYSLTTERGRCVLQLWSDERNIVRRVSGAVERGAGRNGMLRVAVQRFGQARASSLEVVADQDRRTPTTREATRVRYLRVLERAMLRTRADGWGEWIFRLEPLIVRPERYGEPSRFDTTPSQPSVQACSLINIGVILLLLLFDDQTTKIAAPPVAPRA